MYADSIRIRLAVWHTLVVGVLLGAFAAGTWLFLGRTTRARADQSLVIATLAFVETWKRERAEHRASWSDAAAASVEAFRTGGRRLLVFDRNRRLVVLSDSTTFAPALTLRALANIDSGPLTAILRAPERRSGAFTTLDGGIRDEVPIRAYALRMILDGEPMTVVALRSLGPEDEALESFAEAAGISISFVLVLAAVGGYLLARKSLAPVMDIARQAEGISARNLGERLPVANQRDELGRLATVLNGLLARLEQAFAQHQRVAEQQRQFMADASHELRTPVTALCSAADVALAHPGRDPAELIEALDVVRGEGRRLGRLVADLFLLARADAGQIPVRTMPLFLEEVMWDCTRAARGMALARQITLSAPLGEEARFMGDSHLLHRLLMILLDNAIKYTPHGGHVRLQMTRTQEPNGGRYLISVEDSGPGVPPELRERIFERFFRADLARTRARVPEFGSDYTSHEGKQRLTQLSQAEGGGAGLGLSIGRWIAEAHGGTLRLASTGPTGSRFVVELPFTI